MHKKSHFWRRWIDNMVEENTSFREYPLVFDVCDVPLFLVPYLTLQKCVNCMWVDRVKWYLLSLITTIFVALVARAPSCFVTARDMCVTLSLKRNRCETAKPRTKIDKEIRLSVRQKFIFTLHSKNYYRPSSPLSYSTVCKHLHGMRDERKARVLEPCRPDVGMDRIHKKDDYFLLTPCSVWQYCPKQIWPSCSCSLTGPKRTYSRSSSSVQNAPLTSPKCFATYKNCSAAARRGRGPCCSLAQSAFPFSPLPLSSFPILTLLYKQNSILPSASFERSFTEQLSSNVKLFGRILNN